MTNKELTLTLHFVSCRLPSWLYSHITKDLHPRMQALFKTRRLIEGGQVVGVEFNVKDPIDIAEKLPAMKRGQVKVSNLRKSFYLYIPKKECSHFRHKKNEDARIECVFEKGWLKLRWLPKWRFGTAESFFG